MQVNDIVNKILIYFSLSSETGVLKNGRKYYQLVDLAKLLDIKLQELEPILHNADCPIELNLEGHICIKDFNSYYSEWNKSSKKIKSNLDDLRKDIKSKEVKDIIAIIETKFNKPLNIGQVLVEYYKTLKTFDKIDDWDKIYFQGHLGMAATFMKKLGVDNTFLCLKWISERCKFWNLGTIIKMYPFYCKDKDEKVEYTQYYQFPER